MRALHIKTILVPIDFSIVSYNAIDYAIEIAKQAQAKLVLLHVFQIPIILSDVPLANISIEELESNSKMLLDKIKQKISSENSQLEIECFYKCGSPEEEIVYFSRNNAVELIVMGMSGAGVVREKLIGSTTTAVIEECSLPVLVINEGTKFKSLEKIIFASDLEWISNKTKLNALIALAKIYSAEIYILNVVTDTNKIPSQTNLEMSEKLEKYFEDVNYSVHFINQKNTSDGINEFAEKIHAGMVSVVSRKHSFLERLFHETNTKRLAFHATVPLLALHEE